MKQEQQRLQSTRLESPITPHSPFSEDNIAQEERRHECYLAITSAKPRGTTYSDITGRFPVKSSRGHQYLVICYDYNTNCIVVAPTKSRQGFEIRDTIISLLQKLKASGTHRDFTSPTAKLPMHLNQRYSSATSTISFYHRMYIDETRLKGQFKPSMPISSRHCA